MSFKEKIQQGKFVVTSEIAPPKGVNVSKALEGAGMVRGRVDAINVTDLQNSVMRVSSLAMSRLLIESGIEPVFQIACRDRNRLALQSELLSAHVLGIRNVLVITGDHPIHGDHPEAKPVYDLDSVTLLGAVNRLNAGRDLSGNELNGRPDLFPGAVVNPGADPLEPEIIKMEKKVAAGACFFQSQAVYDLKAYEEFAEKTRHLKVPVLAGIVPLKSAGMANYMNKRIPGVTVPDEMIMEMKNAKDKKEHCINIASGLIKRLRPMCRGVHIMPIGWDDVVSPILDMSGL